MKMEGEYGEGPGRDEKEIRCWRGGGARPNTSYSCTKLLKSNFKEKGPGLLSAENILKKRECPY